MATERARATIRMCVGRFIITCIAKPYSTGYGETQGTTPKKHVSIVQSKLPRPGEMLPRPSWGTAPKTQGYRAPNLVPRPRLPNLVFIIVNHIMYADDMCFDCTIEVYTSMIAPCATAVQKLLDIMLQVC